MKPRFLPASREEMEARGWDRLDVILVSGDAYIDSPFIGAALIGRALEAAGFRVGIIAQPGPDAERDIARLGEPRLFWGISGGAVDSMVANYTASGLRRKSDDYTPGGLNTRRPDRAVIVYSNLIRRVFKKTAPIVLGGIEASLRRLAHYDWWENRIRRSILFDAKADYLLYGMADHSSTELARCLHEGRPPLSLRGLCYKAEAVPPEALLLPSFQEVREDKTAFTRMFRLFHENSEPLPARMLAQAQDSRFLIHNPPPLPLSTAELDAVHELPFMREAHPLHQAEGPIRALDTIRFALSTHRGCYGECNFCAIAIHQGRTIQSRSPASIIREAETFSRHPRFKGMISDVGGPTANMYGFDCARKTGKGACRHRRCLFPAVCPNLKADHRPFIRLLRDLRGLPGISKVAVASGLRHDLLLADEKNGLHCLRELVRHHVSGQMKLAPEHCLPEVLATMGKPGMESLLHFRRLFNRLTREEGLPQYLSYYLLAAHPGCTQAAMEELRAFCRKELRVLPRQAQLFTPTPSTWSTCMYWTESNPFDGRPCFVEKDRARREAQKAALTRPIRPAAGRLSRRSGKR